MLYILLISFQIPNKTVSVKGQAIGHPSNIIESYQEYAEALRDRIFREGGSDEDTEEDERIDDTYNLESDAPLFHRYRAAMKVGFQNYLYSVFP